MQDYWAQKMIRLLILLGAIAVSILVLTFNTKGTTLMGVTNDRLASLLFLGILGTAIIAGSLPKFGQWRNALRDALLWILIILVFMVGYIYRYEMQDMGSKLTAGLIPGSPISSTALDGKKQVTLIKDNSGHYRATAIIDGIGIDFLIDTGASAIVLNYKDAITSGVNAEDLRFNILVSTANGETRTARYRFNELNLGGIKRKDVAVMIAKKGDLDTSLLGMTFLGSLSGFQIAGDRLILTD